MVESLKQLGNNVVGRYKTLENNIKCRSNSFYDSYLDLLELTYKTILTNEDIGYFGRTCGEILKEPDVINFFLHIVKMDKAIYEKSKDYILKINQHKHHNEKYINLDAVLSYISLYFSIVKCYYDYKHYEFNDFDINGIKQIYGITQKRSDGFDDIKKDYKEMTDMVKTELSTINKKIDMLDPDERRKDKYITVEFYSKCKKNYIWRGAKKKTYLFKSLMIFLALVCLGLTVVGSIYVSKFYNKFFYLSYIFHSVVIANVLLYLYCSIRASHKVEHSKLNQFNVIKGVKDDYGIYYFTHKRNIFYFLPTFIPLYFLINLIFIITFNAKDNVLGIVFECLSLILFLALNYVIFWFFGNYKVICYEGHDTENKEVTYVYDQKFAKTFKLEDYKQKYPYPFQ